MQALSFAVQLAETFYNNAQVDFDMHLHGSGVRAAVWPRTGMHLNGAYRLAKHHQWRRPTCCGSSSATFWRASQCSRW